MFLNLFGIFFERVRWDWKWTKNNNE